MDKRLKTTDQKIHNFQLTQIKKKRKAKKRTIDFISMLGQQNFEDDTEVNPTEIEIGNDKIQNMFKKYKKNPCQIHS